MRLDGRLAKLEGDAEGRAIEASVRQLSDDDLVAVDRMLASDRQPTAEEEAAMARWQALYLKAWGW